MLDADDKQFKIKISNIICERVIEIFNNMFNVKVKISEQDLTSLNDDDLVSQVKLYNDDLNITLRFSFPRPLLVPLLQQIYDPIIANHETTIQDATCEIANIVCGGIKKNLGELGHRFNMDLPAVDYSFSASKIEGDCSLEINFILQELAFLVDCNIKAGNKKEYEQRIL